MKESHITIDPGYALDLIGVLPEKFRRPNSLYSCWSETVIDVSPRDRATLFRCVRTVVNCPRKGDCLFIDPGKIVSINNKPAY